MENNISLYRKRYIPNEIIHLKDDEILQCNDEIIITRWRTLKPRTDISRGISAYFMKKGYKISKIYDSNEKVVYWYCDIIQVNNDTANHSIIFEDLLADVIVYENNIMKIMDIGEVADALDQNLIDVVTVSKALHTLDDLLDIIYSGRFHELQKYVNDNE